MQEYQVPTLERGCRVIEHVSSRARPWWTAAALLLWGCGGSGTGSSPKTVEVQTGEGDVESTASSGAGMDRLMEGTDESEADRARDGGETIAEGEGAPLGTDVEGDGDGDAAVSMGEDSDAPSTADGTDDSEDGAVAGAEPGFRCPEVPLSAPPWLAGEPPEVTLVKDGFRFLEGPVWVADRHELYFSDMLMGMDGPNGPPANIHRLNDEGVIEVFVEGGNSNGLSLAPDGRLLAATHDERTLSYFDLDSAERETLELSYMGEPFNSPNDVAVRTDGQVYFTDPDWQRAGRATDIGMTGVYRIDLQGRVQLVDDSLDKPNGISFSPDETVLYVSSLSGTYRYSVEADGQVSDRRLFAPIRSDGMVVDCAGHVYLTSGSVQVFSAEGDMFGSIPVEGQSPTNVAFGGPERRTLFITAGGGLYRVGLDVPGFPY